MWGAQVELSLLSLFSGNVHARLSACGIVYFLSSCLSFLFSFFFIFKFLIMMHEREMRNRGCKKKLSERHEKRPDKICQTQSTNQPMHMHGMCIQSLQER